MVEQAVSPEVQLMLRTLQSEREHAVGILDGLDEETLRRVSLPSGWSALTMIKHLTGMERFWFRMVLATDPAFAAGNPPGDEDNEWVLGPNDTAASIFAAYRAEWEHTDSVIAGLSMDAPPVWWPESWTDYHLDTAREAIMHVITETACHAGHLDIVRELVDGRQWFVLEE